LRSRDLCFFDVETTGTLFGVHEIIDIGALRTSFDGLKEKGQWTRRVRPRHPDKISPKAREVNGFSEEEWSTENEASEGLWSEFVSFVEGCVPVAHNPSFERAFLTFGAAAEGIKDLKLDYHWIGTESLAWPFYLSGELKEMSLGAICDFLGIPRESDPHRGINGAVTCNRVYCALLERHRVRP
jgi:DNA polymerase III epsilon subunit-like protein